MNRSFLVGDEDSKNLVISLTQTTSRDELLFLFQLIDEGNRIDISEMANKSTQKSLKKLFKEHWKLSKNRDGYVKKKKCRKAPVSCREWYLNLLRENGILPMVLPPPPPQQVNQFVPPPPPPSTTTTNMKEPEQQQEVSIGPSFSRKSKLKLSSSRKGKKSLFDMHQERMTKGEDIIDEQQKKNMPEYSENPYNPDKIRRRRQELKREELGRMTNEEKERMKKSGYLTFSKSQVSGSSRNENKEKIKEYKTSIKRSFHSSRY